MKSKPRFSFLFYIRIAKVLVLSAGWIPVSAQNISLASHQLPQNYALPTPEAAGVTKVADIPVTLGTGQANVSIPLYTITSGKLSLPISLDYDASGIRVEQEASDVGLGWTLNAGGAITRAVRDKDDYQTTANYHQIGGDLWNDVVPNGTYPTMQQYDIAYRVATVSLADAIPDLYTYRIAGLSGKFVNLGTADGIRQIPKKNIAINGGYKSWNLTDGNGSLYQFGDENNDSYYETNNLRTFQSSNSGNSDGAQSIRTAWYVRQIKDKDNTATIDFQYDKTYVEYNNGRTRSQIYEVGTLDYFTVANLLDAAESRTSQRINSVVVKKITFNNGSVEFLNSMNNRQDQWSDPAHPMQPRLEAVLVKNNKGETIREIDFGYSYFTAANAQNPTYTDKRLKLDAIYIINGTAPAEKYAFTYSTIAPPSKNSYAVDHWGYYNGHDENNTLIPRYGYLNPDFSTNSTPDFLTCPSSAMMFNGAYKETDPNYVKAGSLTEIQYPTSGRVKFNYECHTVNQSEYIYDYTYINKPPNFVVKTSATSFQSPDGTVSYNAGNTGPVSSYYFFTIPNNSLTAGGVKAKFASYASWPSNAASTVITHANTHTSLAKKNSSGGYDDVKSFIYADANMPMPAEDCQDNIILPPGDYRVIAQTGGIGFQIKSYITVLIPKTIYASSTIKNVGGLRIKDITYADPISNGSRYIHYSYANPQDPVKTSGYTFAPITRNSYMKSCNLFYGDRSHAPSCWYYPSNNTQAVQIPCCYLKGDGLVLSSTTNVDFGDGANVNYEYVTVTEGNGENGKTLQQFSRAPGIHLSYLDGLPLHTWTYSASNTLVQETANEYTAQPGTEEHYGFKILAKGNHPCAEAPNTTNPNLSPGAGFLLGYEWQPIRMRSEWIPLTKTTTTQYFDAAPPLIQTETYTYNPLNLEVAKIEHSTSDNRTTAQYFKYPVDYTSPPSSLPSNELKAVLTLKNQHAHSQVVEKYSSVISPNSGEQVTEGSYVGFSPIPSSLVTEQTPEGPVSHYTAAQADNIFTTESASSLSGFQPSYVANNGGNTNIAKDPAYKLQYSVLKYDTRLNPLETKNEHGVKSALLWMYNSELLSAETVNAGQDQIAFTSFEDASNGGNWTYNASAITTSDKLTGSVSYNLSAGSLSSSSLPAGDYVISYWRKGGSSTVNGSAPTFAGQSAGGWTYFEHHLNNPSSLSINGSGLVDEVRLYPSGATMKTWCHAPLVGISSICDENNHIQYYEYDEMGRLSVIRNQDGNIVKKLEYGVQQAD